MTGQIERKYSPVNASVDVDGRFCGYASLFGFCDLSGDEVARGAFARSLRMRGAGGIQMLLEHQPSAVIGHWTVMDEDERGLWVEGRLDRSRLAGTAGTRMRTGQLDGLSIGFRTVRADEDRSRRVRRLLEVDLMEVSVVCTPMLPEARARAAAPTRSNTLDGAAARARAGSAEGQLIAQLHRAAALLRETRWNG